MKRLLIILFAFGMSVMIGEAKISFGNFSKAGFLSAIKEQTERLRNIENKNKKENKNDTDDVADTETYDTTDFQSDEMDSSDVKNFCVNIDDTRYQWSQGKSKDQEALMSSKGLKINNKVEDDIYVSTVELPIVVENDDFVFGVVASTEKLNDKTGWVLLFDYQDNHNFKAIVISKEQFQYMVFHDGRSSIVKTGLVKFPKKSSINTFYILREASIVRFFLNDVEYDVFKNVVIKNPIFGVGVKGKTSIIIQKMIFDFKTSEEDIEQSTT